MLKIYTDENVEIAISVGLKRRNIDAWSANDVSNLGISDEAHLEYAVSQHACLFTYDTDFFEIHRYWSEQGKTHFGIFYIHPLNTSIGDAIRKLKEYAELFDTIDVKNQLIFL